VATLMCSSSVEARQAAVVMAAVVAEGEY